MRILVYSIYGYVTPHFETEMELVKSHMEKGDDVSAVICHKTFDLCMWNPNKHPGTCSNCQRRIYRGFELIGLSGLNVYPLHDFVPEDFALPEISTVADLKAFTYEGADVGMAAASSLISQARDHGFPFAERAEQVRKTLRAGINAYENGRYYVEALKPDLIYVFNGRFAEQRPFFRAAQQAGVEVAFHERGATYHSFHLFKNRMPHEISRFVDEARADWNAEESLSEKSKIAEDWFLSRRNRSETTWHSYTKKQQESLLPEGFYEHEHRIAIFNSSEDEFAAIQGWEDALFEDQDDAINWLCETYEHDKSRHFFLRVHPNLGGLENTQAKQIAALNHENLTIIDPLSPIDTYALMEACEKSITFGSTTGVEATYWNVPSILLGSALYRDLGCVYTPKDEETLKVLIEAKDLKPCEKEGAYVYGYHSATRGQPFEYFEPTGLFTGTFCGIKVSPEDGFKEGAIKVDEQSPVMLSLKARNQANGDDAHALPPLVSIVVFNDGDTSALAESLSAIDAQTYPNYECSILDQTSSSELDQNIATTLKRLNNPRVIFLRSTAPTGTFDAYNHGLAVADGSYVVFLHAGQSLPPDFLERCLEQHLTVAATAGYIALDPDSERSSLAMKMFPRSVLSITMPNNLKIPTQQIDPESYFVNFAKELFAPSFVSRPAENVSGVLASQASDLSQRDIMSYKLIRRILKSKHRDFAEQLGEEGAVALNKKINMELNKNKPQRRSKGKAAIGRLVKYVAGKFRASL
ncbi:MAG: glycosyltransferase family 2 protein [Filomicrobium sp.]